jgi:hypothetical protein
MSNHHPRPWLAVVLSLFFVLTLGFRMLAWVSSGGARSASSAWPALVATR